MPGWPVSDKSWWEMETVGKYMERNWKGLENLRGVEEMAVMRGSAVNARLIRQMMYAIWFLY